MATRDIVFKFLGEAKSLGRAADSAQKSLGGVDDKTKKLADRMNRFGKGLTAGVTLPIVGAFTAGFNSLRENEELMAQTNAVIDSMGNVAGKSADEVFDLANEISSMSGLAHENVVEGQNMLLTFGNIRNELGEGNDVFDQSTRLLADMAVATGQDMKGAAVSLGKALNDPTKGITALTRVGVSFTKEQEEQIKALSESGDVMGAQKIILGELEKQFGGSAEALGGTMTGSINKMKNSFEELTRNLAQAVVPIMEKLVGVVQNVLTWFNNLSPGMKDVVRTLAVVAAAVGPVLIVGAKLVKSFQTVMTAFKALSALMMTNPWALLIAAVVALVVLIVKNWDEIVAFLSEVWEKIVAAAKAVGEFISEAFGKAVEFVKKLFLNFTPLGLIIKNFDKIKSLARSVWETLKKWFQKAVDFIVGIFKNFTPLGFIISKFDKIKEVARGASDFIKEKFTSVIDFFRDMPGKIGRAVSGMWDGIKDAFRGSINWLIKKWNNFSLKLGGQHVSLPFGLSFTIPSVTLRTPNIPTIHSGGIFRAPSLGGEGLALLRDGERITPASQASEPMLVQLVVDGRILAESLIRHEEALA